MSEWLVELHGDPDNLRVLSRLLTSDPRITEEEDGFYLRSAEYEALTDPGQVRDLARQQLTFINGAARLQFGASEPFQTGCIISIDESGTPTRYVLLETSREPRKRARFATATLSVTSPDGEAVPAQPTFFELAVRLARHDPAVAAALRFFLDPTWASLHKVYELIDEDVGGKTAIAARFQGITTNEIDRFTGSANNRHASGDQARHVWRKQTPPKRVMSLKEAQSFIHGLLDQWIRSKCRGNILVPSAQ